MVRSMLNLTTSTVIPLLDYALESAVRILTYGSNKKWHTYDYEIWQNGGYKLPLELVRLDEDIYMAQLRVPLPSAVGNLACMLSGHTAVVEFCSKLVCRYQRIGKLTGMLVLNIFKVSEEYEDMFLVYGGDPDTELVLQAVNWKCKKPTTIAMQANTIEYKAA
ncbi:hypothetical protein Tco_0465353 [Tanacetum coccineum]